MKKVVTLGVLALACVCLVPAPSVRATSDEAEIRKLLDAWAVAFRARDVDGVMAMYDSGVLAFDFVAPLEYVGADAYRKDYADFFAAFDGPLEVEYRDLRVAVGGDVAFATGLERIAGTTKGGQRIDFWGRFTCGFRKINGRWRDVHDHVSVPTDFATGKAVLDLKP
jgi:ketosteroid isomerase-like protein